MTDFFSLVKVQFLSLFGFNKALQSKKGKSIGVAAPFVLLAVLGVLIGALGYVYSEMATGTFSQIIASMLPYNLFIILFLSFYTVGNVLYGYKDYDLLISMPIKTRSVVASKLFIMYLSDFAFSLCFIAGVVIRHAGMLVTSVILRLSVVLLFLPAIILIVSVIIGFLVTYLSSFFKKKGVAQSVFYLMLLGAMIISTVLSDGDMFSLLFKFSAPIVKVLNDWTITLYYVIIAMVSLIVVVVFVSLTYAGMNSIVKRVRTKGNFRLNKTTGRSVLTSLFVKELKTIFSFAIYIINNVVSPVLSIIIGIIILQLGVKGITFLYLLAPIVYSFTYMLTPLTNCSISMEGDCFWILRTAPVSTRKIFNVKILVGLTFSVLPAIVCSTLISIGIGGGFWLCFLNVLCAILISIMGVLIGLTFNILFPMLKWEHPNKPVKQSLSVILTMIVAMAFSVLSLLFVLYGPFANQIHYHLLIVLGVALIISVALYIFIMKMGEKILFKKA